MCVLNNFDTENSVKSGPKTSILKFVIYPENCVHNTVYSGEDRAEAAGSASQKYWI